MNDSNPKANITPNENLIWPSSVHGDNDENESMGSDDDIISTDLTEPLLVQTKHSSNYVNDDREDRARYVSTTISALLEKMERQEVGDEDKSHYVGIIEDNNTHIGPNLSANLSRSRSSSDTNISSNNHNDNNSSSPSTELIEKEDDEEQEDDGYVGFDDPRLPLQLGVDSRKVSWGLNQDSSLLSHYNDQPQDMTYGRRIARYLSKYNWYNPLQDSNNVKLDDGWAFFEHITLYRHFIPEEGDEGLERADQGESSLPTMLYSVWSTPRDQLGDFGIGIGIYFDTILWLAWITFGAGCMSIFNLWHYEHGDYTAGNTQEDVHWILRGSAVCTDILWVPCADCTIEDWYRAEDRFATNEDQTLVFAIKNECIGTDWPEALMNLGIVIFLAVALQIMTWKQRHTEVAFDLDEQTAQDYSITVDGCPPDALDPDEWKTFLTQIAQSKVTVVTIAIDNDKLLQALLDHRILRFQLKSEEMMKEAAEIWDEPLDDEENIRNMLAHVPPKEASACESFLVNLGLRSDIRASYERLVTLKDHIRELSRKKYEATDVFVTFETEAGQRKVLHSLSVGVLDLWKWRSDAHISEHCKFRGTEVLSVIEAPEPSAIRWFDLPASEWDIKKGIIMSTLFSLLAIFLSCKFVMWRTSCGDPLIAIYISSMNGIVPLGCKYIMEYERHQDEGARSKSLFFKLTVFRWVNTAVIISIATPFTDTLGFGDYDLIPYLYTIFCLELVWSPALAFPDIVGNFRRHYLGPRAKTQDEVNAQFRGEPYEIAERYTVVTKLLFLSFFYAVLFPAGFFVCSVALFLCYFTDKFCIMRSWAPAPMIGNEIAEMNRTVFFPLCLIALFMMNGYHYARFPYDNLCETSSSAGSDYSGSYEIFTEAKVGTPENAVNVTISSTDSIYEFCNQDLLAQWIFPPSSSAQGDHNWMGDEGSLFTIDVFAWVGFAFTFSYLILNYGMIFVNYIDSCFRSDYEPSGDDMKIDFSNVKSISTYIPEIRAPDHFNFPLIATNFEDVDSKLMDWNDPIKGYSEWDIRDEFPDDVRHLLEDKKKPILSIVKHYR